MDELGGLNQAPLRRSPTSQGLEAHDPALAQVDDRLEDGDDLVTLDSPLKRNGELVTAADLRVHPGLVVGKTLLADALRRVHRDVGVLQELIGARSGRGGSDSDAAVHSRLPAVKCQRPSKRLQKRLRDDLAAVSIGRVEQHGELVAAEARRCVRRAHRPLDTTTDLGEHVVADRVAERVVDRLEVVEIDEQHRSRTVAACHHRFDPLGEEGTVRQSGEYVVEGLVAQLLLQVGRLGQRPLEPAVLEQHARVTDEGLEQPLVVRVERDDVAGAVGDDGEAEHAVLSAERGDDPVGHRPRSEVAVERVRGTGCRQQDRVRSGPERREDLRVRRADDIRVGGHLAVRAERAPQALL